jgi:hypothetical protein
MAALGVLREDRMAILDHSEGDVHEAHYDRYDRLREKRLALDLWASCLEELLYGFPDCHSIVFLEAKRG